MRWGAQWNEHAGSPNSIYFGDNIPHKKYEKRTDPLAATFHVPSRVIKTIGEHQLIKTWQGSWYDSAPIHGWRCIGRKITPTEAERRWREMLRREGIDEQG